MKVLLLTDEELLLLEAWADMTKSGTLHDFEDDDEQLLEKIQAARDQS